MRVERNDQRRHLIIMTRIPEAGRVKTRLVPTLGPDGAAAVHAALLDRTLRMVENHVGQSGVSVEVRFTGGTPEAAASLQTESLLKWREQQGIDLGDRMHVAMTTALKEEATAVIVIGTDCPDLSPDILNRAWSLLDRHDLVLGPAEDGGYYLIGMKQSDQRMFTGIDWGTEHVLRQTQHRGRELKKLMALLPILGDVDEAENLILCRRFGSDFANCLPQQCPGLLSIVIPALNEAGQLEHTIDAIQQQASCEIIIADGGSTDGTVELAKQRRCRVIFANRGRGRQMNAGAALARGEHLLFLHADTRLPINFREEIHQTLNSGAIAGAFRLQVDDSGAALRCVAWGTNLRARFLQLPYGDQGLFLRSQDFYAIGGYRNWSLMEDVDLCRRLKRTGRICLTKSPAVTSGRRWKRLGVLRNTLLNQICMAMYFAGLGPERIAEFYKACGRSKHQPTD